MWEYEFSKESIKALEGLNTKTRDLVKKKIKNIGEWLDNRDFLQVDVKKLKGRWKGFYRLRIGRIRVIITIDEKNELIRVYEMGFRGDVYK